MDPRQKGHRASYKAMGVSKQSIQAVRTKNNISPLAEHALLAKGKKTATQGKTETPELNQHRMKELMDWIWAKRHQKFQGMQDSEDKQWAPADAIPTQMRPKLRQITKYNWTLENPYPGYRLITDQGRGGWKTKIVSEQEAAAFEMTSNHEPTSSQARIRAEAAGPRTNEQKIAIAKSRTLHSGPLSDDPDLEINLE